MFEPSDIYDTHVNIDENLQIDINIYNALLLKANNIICSFKISWFPECMELNLPVLLFFIKTFGDERLKKS